MSIKGYRITFWRAFFFVLLTAGLALTYTRFTQGLGSVTNMSDRYPWGLWVGFDLLCGVGLAAGGFVITATVYVFHIKRLQPIVRPTIVTAFLGYILVVVALLYDIGRPWNIWHAIIMWNPRSVMFEVAWCVMLYSTVLALEFSGMVFERLRWARAVRIQRLFTVPLVIAGVILSTLHQSSLGSLFLIAPEKLHVLWYTPLLPVLFFISAISVGLAMVVVESRLSSRAFGRQLEMPLLKDVGRALVAVLVVLAVIRVYDLGARGVLLQAFDLGYESSFFLLEFVVGLLVPAVMLAIPRIRGNSRALYGASLLVVMGFIVNRLNVSITGFDAGRGGPYVPAIGEMVITLMLVAIGFAAFGLAVRYFNVYPEDHAGSVPSTG